MQESAGEIFENLVKIIKAYNPEANFELLERAFNVALTAHEGQFRVSGEPYITHPMMVACILAEMELDTSAIAAAILHDVVEDTSYTYEEAVAEFGQEIADLIIGVTKLTKIPYSTKQEQQAENLRKMIMSMAKDIRVILIKLADRLHNMRTLSSMPEKKRREKACETMEIYAPLAHRLGMSRVKWELEDCSLRYLDPVAYKEITSNIAEKRVIREKYLESIKATIAEKLERMGINGDIQSRAKHFYSIYRKMYSQNISIDQIYDLLAVRVLVESVTDCYAVLGMVHEIFRPIPGRFKDYIAMPKKNMYQSLHTTLIGPSGTPFEVQIRTWDMHRVAEVGIAAHWTYKEGGNTGDADDKFSWIRQLIEAYQSPSDSEEIVTSLKVDLFEDEVFVFTPQGDLISLPAGSTAIDFAYSIHSQIGDKMVGVKIGGKIRPLGTRLRNGDIVEVITSKTANGPSRDWLKMVASNAARRKINEFFKREQRDENIERGKHALDRELKRNGLYDIAHNNLDIWQKAVLEKYNLTSMDDLMAMVGYGGLSVLKIMSKLKDSLKAQIDEHKQKEEEAKPKAAPPPPPKPASGSGKEIIVRGIDNCLVRFAKCCNPVHGDAIMGYITRGRGVTVHHANCINVTEVDEEQKARMIEVEWGGEAKTSYLSSIKVIVDSRTGIFVNVAAVISEMKIAIRAVEAREGKNKTEYSIMHFTLDIPNKEALEKIISRIRKVSGVISVERSTN